MIFPANCNEANNSAVDCMYVLFLLIAERLERMRAYRMSVFALKYKVNMNIESVQQKEMKEITA